MSIGRNKSLVLENHVVVGVAKVDDEVCVGRSPVGIIEFKIQHKIFGFPLDNPLLCLQWNCSCAWLPSAYSVCLDGVKHHMGKIGKGKAVHD